MDFLSNDHIAYLREHYSVLIGWITTTLYPIGALIITKLIAIARADNPTNGILDLIRNRYKAEKP